MEGDTTIMGKYFDIEESKSSGSKILIIIVLSALIIAIGIFIWFKFFK